MECPYCHHKMKKGYIHSAKFDIRWTPEDVNTGFFLNIPNDKEVSLAKMPLLGGCKIKVYRCENCKIEIINEMDMK